MAGSSAVPIKCYKCGKLPELNKQGFVKAIWYYKTRKQGHQTSWYTLCSDCKKLTDKG